MRVAPPVVVVPCGKEKPTDRPTTTAHASKASKGATYLIRAGSEIPPGVTMVSLMIKRADVVVAERKRQEMNKKGRDNE